MSAPLQDGWIESFLAFAKSKPADERYPEYRANACALAQFGYPFVSFSNRERRGVPQAAYDAATMDGPFTFGALADRLAALVPPPPVDKRP